jgi:hypothetical protein
MEAVPEFRANTKFSVLSNRQRPDSLSREEAARNGNDAPSRAIANKPRKEASLHSFDWIGMPAKQAGGRRRVTHPEAEPRRSTVR